MNLNKIKKSSYLILVIFLVIFETFHITKGHWQGDFFEHSAVVNELSKNLLHPNNPIIKSNTSHAFFSPYSILVASFSKVTDLNSINSLAYFAYFNLIFFLYSLYFFQNLFLKKLRINSFFNFTFYNVSLGRITVCLEWVLSHFCVT